jgi:hypothetical protein
MKATAKRNKKAMQKIILSLKLDVSLDVDGKENLLYRFSSTTTTLGELEALLCLTIRRRKKSFRTTRGSFIACKFIFDHVLLTHKFRNS